MVAGARAAAAVSRQPADQRRRRPAARAAAAAPTCSIRSPGPDLEKLGEYSASDARRR